MPRSARNQVALQPVSSNTLPATPGRQVKQLKGELDLKEKENAALKDQIAELSKAISGIQLVKDKIGESNVPMEKSETKKVKKAKDPNAPVPAKTAYRYFCDENPLDGKTTGDAMRLKWKECQGEMRTKYVNLAAEDKKRFEAENAVYQEKMSKIEAEEKALDKYYQKQKQDLALEFFEAHQQAQKALDAKKSKKTKKDPEAPKRAMSSYFFFVQVNRAKFVKKHPNASVTELSRILGEEWSKLNKGKGGKKGTKKYDQMALEDKERYLAEKEVYEATKSEREKKLEEEREKKLLEDKEEAMKLQREEDEKIQQMLASTTEAVEEPETVKAKETKTKKNGPKRASSAYNYYVAQNRSGIKAYMPETTTPQELMTEIGRQWKLMSDSQKVPYENLAAQDKIRYQNELAALESSM